MKNKSLWFTRCLAAVLLPVAGGSMVKGASIAAQWNFDDPGTAGGSVSNVGGFVGTFSGVGGRTAGGGGVSATAGDYAFDPRLLANAANGAMNVEHAGVFGRAECGDLESGDQHQLLAVFGFHTDFDSVLGHFAQRGGIGANRGLNAHSPWVDGNVYFDTGGCCDGTNRVFGPLGATIGDWQHMTLVYINGTREVYLNNTLVASGGGGVSLGGDFNFFVIGNDLSLTNLGMDARLDNFTIWNGALTPAEIAVLSVRPTIPEPSAAILGMLGALVLSGRRRRS